MTLYKMDDDWTKRTAWAADTLAGLDDLGVLVKWLPDYEAAYVEFRRQAAEGSFYPESIVDAAFGIEEDSTP